MDDFIERKKQLLEKFIGNSLINRGKFFTIKDFEDFKAEQKDFLSLALREQKDLMKQQFINEFCNDHNEHIRWLRGVAFDMDDLLMKILKFFSQKEQKEENEK